MALPGDEFGKQSVCIIVSGRPFARARPGNIQYRNTVFRYELVQYLQSFSATQRRRVDQDMGFAYLLTVHRRQPRAAFEYGIENYRRAIGVDDVLSRAF